MGNFVLSLVVIELAILILEIGSWVIKKLSHKTLIQAKVKDMKMDDSKRSSKLKCDIVLSVNVGDKEVELSPNRASRSFWDLGINEVVDIYMPTKNKDSAHDIAINDFIFREDKYNREVVEIFNTLFNLIVLGVIYIVVLTTGI